MPKNSYSVYAANLSSNAKRLYTTDANNNPVINENINYNPVWGYPNIGLVTFSKAKGRKDEYGRNLVEKCVFAKTGDYLGQLSANSSEDELRRSGVGNRAGILEDVLIHINDLYETYEYKYSTVNNTLDVTSLKTDVNFIGDDYDYYRTGLHTSLPLNDKNYRLSQYDRNYAALTPLKILSATENNITEYEDNNTGTSLKYFMDFKDVDMSGDNDNVSNSIKNEISLDLSSNDNAGENSQEFFIDFCAAGFTNNSTAYETLTSFLNPARNVDKTKIFNATHTKYSVIDLIDRLIDRRWCMGVPQFGIKDASMSKIGDNDDSPERLFHNYNIAFFNFVAGVLNNHDVWNVNAPYGNGIYSNTFTASLRQEMLYKQFCNIVSINNAFLYYSNDDKYYNTNGICITNMGISGVSEVPRNISVSSGDVNDLIYDLYTYWCNHVYVARKNSGIGWTIKPIHKYYSCEGTSVDAEINVRARGMLHMNLGQGGIIMDEYDAYGTAHVHTLYTYTEKDFDEINNADLYDCSITGPFGNSIDKYYAYNKNNSNSTYNFYLCTVNDFDNTFIELSKNDNYKRIWQIACGILENGQDASTSVNRFDIAALGAYNGNNPFKDSSISCHTMSESSSSDSMFCGYPRLTGGGHTLTNMPSSNMTLVSNYSVSNMSGGLFVSSIELLFKGNIKEDFNGIEIRIGDSGNSYKNLNYFRDEYGNKGDITDSSITINNENTNRIIYDAAKDITTVKFEWSWCDNTCPAYIKWCENDNISNGYLDCPDVLNMGVKVISDIQAAKHLARDYTSAAVSTLEESNPFAGVKLSNVMPECYVKTNSFLTDGLIDDYATTLTFAKFYGVIPVKILLNDCVPSNRELKVIGAAVKLKDDSQINIGFSYYTISYNGYSNSNLDYVEKALSNAKEYKVEMSETVINSSTYNCTLLGAINGDYKPKHGTYGELTDYGGFTYNGKKIGTLLGANNTTEFPGLEPGNSIICASYHYNNCSSDMCPNNLYKTFNNSVVKEHPFMVSSDVFIPYNFENKYLKESDKNLLELLGFDSSDVDNGYVDYGIYAKVFDSDYVTPTDFSIPDQQPSDNTLDTEFSITGGEEEKLTAAYVIKKVVGEVELRESSSSFNDIQGGLGAYSLPLPAGSLSQPHVFCFDLAISLNNSNNVILNNLAVDYTKSRIYNGDSRRAVYNEQGDIIVQSEADNGEQDSVNHHKVGLNDILDIDNDYGLEDANNVKNTAYFKLFNNKIIKLKLPLNFIGSPNIITHLDDQNLDHKYFGAAAYYSKILNDFKNDTEFNDGLSNTYDNENKQKVYARLKTMALSQLKIGRAHV